MAFEVVAIILAVPVSVEATIMLIARRRARKSRDR